MATAFSRALASAKGKVSRKGNMDLDYESQSQQSAYMGSSDESSGASDFSTQESKVTKMTDALSRGFSSAKYATVRSAKGIKIGVQERVGDVKSSSPKFTSRLRGSKKDGRLNESAVPSV